LQNGLLQLVFTPWDVLKESHWVLGKSQAFFVKSGNPNSFNKCVRFEVLTVVIEDFCLFECGATSW